MVAPARTRPSRCVVSATTSVWPRRSATTPWEISRAPELEAEGVQLVAERRRGTTALAQIQVVGAERSVAWRRGTAEGLDPDGVDAWLDGVDLLYVDGHQLPCANAAIAAARERGIDVLADLGTLRAGMREWLPHLVWSVASRRFACEFAESEDPRDGIDALEHASSRAIGVGVTLGGRGGVARIAGRDVTWGPRKVRVMDTTAAGDAFHAGLADAVLRGLEPETSLQWASAVGAAVCRGLGGRRWLPRDRARMQDFERAWPELATDADRARG